MATCTELYIDTLGGLDLDGSTDKNLPYFVVENLAALAYSAANVPMLFSWPEPSPPKLPLLTFPRGEIGTLFIHSLYI